MSAEYLRETAALMRAEATDAEATGAWEWRGENGEVWWQQATRAGRFIQSQSPAVALAVADWLDATASHIDKRWTSVGDAVGAAALAVARAYRGDS